MMRLCVMKSSGIHPNGKPMGKEEEAEVDITAKEAGVVAICWGKEGSQ